MNPQVQIQNPRDPAVISGAIYIVSEVIIYLIGVIWPEAAPHAQFVSSKLTPIIIIFAVWATNKQQLAVPPTIITAEPPSVTTRSIGMDDLIVPKDFGTATIKGESKPYRYISAVLRPVEFAVGKVFGFLFRLPHEVTIAYEEVQD